MWRDTAKSERVKYKELSSLDHKRYDAEVAAKREELSLYKK